MNFGGCYCHLSMLYVWQMEDHSGKCYDHIYWVNGRSCCLCCRWISHLGWIILSPQVLNRTSSHMWGRWHMPLFLFRDRLLTLVYIASFVSLMRLWSSLPNILMFSNVVVWPVVLQWSYIGEGVSDVFEPLSKCSGGFSYIFFIIFYPVTFESVYDATLLGHRIFVLRCHQEVFDGFGSIKEFREDDTRMILTPDKGIVLVVMDKDDNIKKAEDLLNQPTYKLIPADPSPDKK